MRLELQGACARCPAREMTRKHVLEPVLRARVPGVTSVLVELGRLGRILRRRRARACRGFAFISTRPVKIAPSSTTRRGGVDVAVDARGLVQDHLAAWRVISPCTSPEITIICERIVAVIEPVSPTISVFSLEISPSKRPSMRTVSLKLSLPENSEPWSMNAVSAPTPLLAGPVSPPSLPLPKSLNAILPPLLLRAELPSLHIGPNAASLENSRLSGAILPLADDRR